MDKTYEVYIGDDGIIVVTKQRTGELTLCGRVGNVALEWLNKHASDCVFISEYADYEEEYAYV